MNKCWTCGSEVHSQGNNFCSRACSTKGMNRSLFIKRTEASARMYKIFYDFDMERLTWIIEEK